MKSIDIYISHCWFEFPAKPFKFPYFQIDVVHIILIVYQFKIGHSTQDHIGMRIVLLVCIEWVLFSLLYDMPSFASTCALNKHNSQINFKHWDRIPMKPLSYWDVFAILLNEIQSVIRIDAVTSLIHNTNTLNDTHIDCNSNMRVPFAEINSYDYHMHEMRWNSINFAFSKWAAGGKMVERTLRNGSRQTWSPEISYHVSHIYIIYICRIFYYYEK